MSATPRLSAPWLIRLAGAWSLTGLAIVCPIVFLSDAVPADAKVVTRMMLTALVLWVGVGGALMLRHREAIVRWWRAVPGPESLKFVAGATALACIEEAITVTMTNLAPVFGGTRGVGGITNTTNYLHLILLHSVIVFVPAFVVWGWLLRRYAFAPAQVFLLYGVTGTLAEALSVRLDSLLAGYWIFVYGLFVWLPAEAMRRPPDLCPPRLRHGVAAVVLPFVAAIPVAFVAIGVDRALGLEHVAMHAAAGAPPAR